MRYRQAAGKLHRLGYGEVPRRGRGSHRVWLNSATGQLATLPDWGPKDLNLWTLRDAVRQLGLTWEEFEQA